MLAGVTAFARSLRSRLTQEGGQARKVFLTVENQLVIGLVRQDVLREARAQNGQFLGDLRHARAPRFVKGGPGTGEHQVVTLQNPCRLGVEVKALAGFPECRDPGVELLVQKGLRGMAGEPWRHLTLDAAQVLGCMASRQVEEHHRNAREITSSPFHRRDGVVEVRLRRIVRDRVDLAPRRFKGRLECRFPVPGLDLAEGWESEGSGPVTQQGVRGRGVGLRFARHEVIRSS